MHPLMVNILDRKFSLLDQNCGDRFGAGLPSHKYAYFYDTRIVARWHHRLGLYIQTDSKRDCSNLVAYWLVLLIHCYIDANLVVP